MFVLFALSLLGLPGLFSGSTPRSLPALSLALARDAVCSLGAAFAITAGGSVRAAVVQSGGGTCVCSGGQPCLCEGQRAVREQIQLASKYSYNPCNERIFDTAKKSFVPAHPENYLAKELGGKNVVVVGEIHSNRCHHHSEFETLKALDMLSSGQLAIGLECFYRQHQRALDDFVFKHNDMGTSCRTAHRS